VASAELAAAEAGLSVGAADFFVASAHFSRLQLTFRPNPPSFLVDDRA